MIKTFHMQFHYGRDPYYAFQVWTNGKVVVLGVSALVLGTQGVPLGLQIGDTLRLDSDGKGWRDRGNYSHL